MMSASLVTVRPVALRPEIAVAVVMEVMAVVVKVAVVVASVTIDRKFLFTSQEQDGACCQWKGIRLMQGMCMEQWRPSHTADGHELSSMSGYSVTFALKKVA